MDTKTKQSLAIFLCLFLKLHVSSATDSVTANQSLSGDQTIVSAGGIFELGFFELGGRYYISIWYSNQVVSASTIVWVANREQPVFDKFSSVLRVFDGNLLLSNESKTPGWSTNVTSNNFSSVKAVLLDSGNLVLLDESISSSEPLWQSFDHPTHTWLPGAKIGFNKITNQTQILTSWKNSEDPSPGFFSLEMNRDGSNSYHILWNRSIEYWTSGSWNATSLIFNLIPEMRLNYSYNFSYVTNENITYLSYSLYDPKIVSRLVMSVTGQVEQLTWLENTRQWNVFWSQPRRKCEVHATCGAFGSCNDISGLLCNCLMGFEPKSPPDWYLHDYSDGCSRKTSLQCGTEDRFLEMHNMLMPENKQSVEVRSADKCGSVCLSNCACTTYAYDSNTGCSIWTGDLLGLGQLAEDDSTGRILFIRLAASELMYLKSGKGHNDKRSLIIAMVSAAAGLLAINFGYFLWKKTLRKRREHKRKHIGTKINYGGGGGGAGGGGGKNDTELPVFSLKRILAATDNFSEANKLGEGGFGPVYKGILQENQDVAIKRLSKKSRQGHQEFLNELELIAKLQHTNLVRLLGCCIEEEELLLIYEYMPNRSLDKLLFDPCEKTELDWGKRFRIIEGIAQGVLYIHKYSRLKIIHRDLKASNVLLDGSMNPKISDFGMAKIFEINQTEANTNRVVGTYGYMSPEYARYGHFSEKLDVFSFGVLLLEIVSGKKNTAFYRFEHSPSLAGWAWELWKGGRGMDVIDESVRETCQPNEALRCIHVGFLCVQEAPDDRPTMSLVIHMLQGNEATPLPPSKEPAFSTHRNLGAVTCSPPTPASFSRNSVTISMPEAR